MAFCLRRAGSRIVILARKVKCSKGKGGHPLYKKLVSGVNDYTSIQAAREIRLQKMDLADKHISNYLPGITAIHTKLT